MADQSEMLAVAHRLFASGARLGAAQLLFNAAAQRQAAEAFDLPQRPAFGRRVKAAEQPHAANDHQSASEQPAAPIP